MPETLDLTGMDIDTVSRKFPMLKADYGGGYGDAGKVAGTGGWHRWSLSSGCLPGDVSYGSLIDSKARLDYYWDFFITHTTGEDDLFVIEFRDKTYHAGFVETGIDFERFTEDLFAGSVEIEQRRSEEYSYNDDGSIDFDFVVFELEDVSFAEEGSTTEVPVYAP